jgi:hypothetical protein
VPMKDAGRPRTLRSASSPYSLPRAASNDIAAGDSSRSVHTRGGETPGGRRPAAHSILSAAESGSATTASAPPPSGTVLTARLSRLCVAQYGS